MAAVLDPASLCSEDGNDLPYCGDNAVIDHQIVILIDLSALFPGPVQALDDHIFRVSAAGLEAVGQLLQRRRQ